MEGYGWGGGARPGQGGGSRGVEVSRARVALVSWRAAGMCGLWLGLAAVWGVVRGGLLPVGHVWAVGRGPGLLQCLLAGPRRPGINVGARGWRGVCMRGVCARGAACGRVGRGGRWSREGRLDRHRVCTLGRPAVCVHGQVCGAVEPRVHVLSELARWRQGVCACGAGYGVMGGRCVRRCGGCRASSRRGPAPRPRSRRGAAQWCLHAHLLIATQ